MLRDESGQKPAIDTARGIMARGDREQGACIVVESHGVVKARRLGRLLAEAAHALRTIVKPPGRTEFERGIVASERRELTCIGGLIEREDNDRETALVAIAVEQRCEGCNVVRRLRDVGPFVQTELCKERRIVVTPRTRMYLHD